MHIIAHLLFTLALLLFSGGVYAHASEQAFVLLLPTNVYITSGVLTVVVTIGLLALLPARWSYRLFSSKTIWKFATAFEKTPASVTTRDIVSIASTLFLFALLLVGLLGAYDPLKNPLPLFIWTLWWIGFVVIQGLISDLWQWVNPWTGVYNAITRLFKKPALLALPESVGSWPGVISLILFTLFALADIAPDSPQRLAIVVGLYWSFTLLCMIVFGPRWLNKGECFSILLLRYSQLTTFATHNNHLRVGMPGWRVLANPATTISSAVFILVLLGTGSFDGFNETFYWLSIIGVNPLEFPGRSAVVNQTIIGLILSNILLILIYALCVYAGLILANRQSDCSQSVKFREAFCRLAISILPIALAYHFAHYLIAFLVNVQYAVAAASDPLNSGADLLGLGTFYVTTGFMNSHHSVEAIWLTQAFAVVAGHVLSVLLAHALALDLFGSARRAIISQAPLAAFMVGYTFIGLWLLAAPRGA